MNRPSFYNTYSNCACRDTGGEAVGYLGEDVVYDQSAADDAEDADDGAGHEDEAEQLAAGLDPALLPG